MAGKKPNEEASERRPPGVWPPIRYLSQSFLLTQALDGFELEQRFSVLRPAEVPLDADQVVQANQMCQVAPDGNSLRAWGRCSASPTSTVADDETADLRRRRAVSARDVVSDPRVGPK